MKSYTAHLKPGRPPVLVKEGWSWLAFLFGPLWFAANHAWIPALIQAALLIALTLASPTIALILTAALAIATGLMARDALRWSLERRGYTETHVLAARDHDAALGRLLTYRPDIATSMAALLR